MLVTGTAETPAQDAPRAGSSSEQDATRERLAEIDRDIARLQAELERERGDLGREREALKALDLDIQANSRALREVATGLSAKAEDVAALEADRAAYLEQLATREDELARQVLAAWELSRESRLKLILNQDDPARLGRLLAYYDLVGASQADHISELREALERLAALQREIDTERLALQALQAEQEQARDRLSAQREERLQLVRRIEASLDDGETRLAELTRDRQDLEALLERLDDALADIPTNLGQGEHPAERRGALPMPVPGRVRAAFGQARTAGLTWQGWLIDTQPGAEVRAIAYGRVAYADWLRGYGLLLIVDHGEGFMSLYGHNESLRAEVGDWVRPGETLSTAGQGPGGRPGLYFELRRDGKAVDPAAWIQR